MKVLLGAKQMTTDKEVKETATEWLYGLTANFYDFFEKLARCRQDAKRT
jgi:hypothetical protein